MVRGLHFSFGALGDAGLATLFYPGDRNRLAEARLTGQVPARSAGEPWPVVVMMGGINVAPDTYRWLAHRLVPAGLCVVTYALIGSLGPAGRGITPGIDVAALAPATAGTRPVATALAPLLESVAGIADADADGDGSPVAGRLDVGRVIVVGHSAGGTAALHSSTPEWVPGLQAVFTYGAHTMVSTSLGYGDGTVVAVPAEVPVMLTAGTCDGVIAASRDRYRSETGGDGDVHDPVRRTFEEAIDHRRGDSWLVQLSGAGHFTICDPVDATSGRSFLEPGAHRADPAARELLGDLIAAFLAASLPPGCSASLRQLATHELVAHWDRR